ncbi:MAG: VIT1/CCC1 transporter family protein [Anaerolineales bacterium]|nr:VIT1/CCC1 transporter family protein [Anaerolineales bacterium]
MGLTKRIDQARKAFQDRDTKAAKDAHSSQAIIKAAEEHGGASHQYIGDMVYGGLDGIVTTFAVVSGVAGAELGAGIIIIMGLANLLADGFSMATGAYLSSKSEREYYDRERSREAWEVEHFPDGERLELVEIYKANGYSQQDAESLVEIQSKDKKRWLDAMMVNELGLLPDDRKPILSALATFASFLVAGSVPLFMYLLNLITPVDSTFSFLIALVMSALALFCLGAAKVFVTARNWLRSGLEMLLIGGLAAGVAYLVGYMLRGLGI